MDELLFGSVGMFGRGLALGMAVAAPVGPMSLLCMRQTLARGFLAGLVSGLGIATADGVYGAIAAFGLVALTDLLVGQQVGLRVVGGIMMVYLGIGALRARPAEAAPVDGGLGLARAYAATLGLTLMNPPTILSFAALFAGLGLGAGGGGADRDRLAAALMVAGVFSGSTLWWLLLTGGIALARTRLNARVQRGITITAGLVLLGFGILAVKSVFV